MNKNMSCFCLLNPNSVTQQINHKCCKQETGRRHFPSRPLRAQRRNYKEDKAVRIVYSRALRPLTVPASSRSLQIGPRSEGETNRRGRVAYWLVKYAGCVLCSSHEISLVFIPTHLWIWSWEFCWSKSYFIYNRPLTPPWHRCAALLSQACHTTPAQHQPNWDTVQYSLNCSSTLENNLLETHIYSSEGVQPRASKGGGGIVMLQTATNHLSWLPGTVC